MLLCSCRTDMLLCSCRTDVLLCSCKNDTLFFRCTTDKLLCRCRATANLSLHGRHCSAITNTPVTVIYYAHILLLFINIIKGTEMFCLKGPSYQITAIFSTAHARTFWSGPHHTPFL
jgi:hypothetical protein